MIVKQASRLDHVKEYYFSHKLREVAQMNADGKQVINLGIGKILSCFIRCYVRNLTTDRK